MNIKPIQTKHQNPISELFRSVFTASEGESEGDLIANLARDLITDIDNLDLYGFAAFEGEKIIGAIFFSRLTFEQKIEVFLLAPVAVHQAYQGRGIGQELIRHGLQKMKQNGVQILITYGDPAFYSRVGFAPLSRDLIAAPLELSQPEGWLGQSLISETVPAIPGPSSCVPAFNNPVYW